ncbi:SRPBCC family protein [Myceligenerans halotolerans]
MTTQNPPAGSDPRLEHTAIGVRHDTFTITRHLDAPPPSVFAAFADEQTRRSWFRLPGSDAIYQHDFRVGGGEDADSTFVTLGSAPERLSYRIRYLDIVQNRRIVFTHEATVDDVRRWISLVTVLITDDADGASLLTWTEQVTFLARTGDGSADLPHLRGGTALRLNGLPGA